MASEPFDEFFDVFNMGATPHAFNINLQRSSAVPVAPGTVPQPTHVGTIRTSPEHFKLMVYLMKRQVEQMEDQLGVTIQVSIRVMNTLQIAPEDWNKFWQRPK